MRSEQPKGNPPPAFVRQIGPEMMAELQKELDLQATRVLPASSSRTSRRRRSSTMERNHAFAETVAVDSRFL